MRHGWHEISRDVVPTMKVIFKEHLARYYFEKVLILCYAEAYMNYRDYVISGHFLTDKALWGVATKRCIKTQHSAFTRLLMWLS